MAVTRSAFTPTTVVAALLVLSACSSPSESAPADEQSPLTAYLAAIYGGGAGNEEEQQKRFADDEKKRQAIVAACMTEQGFEYEPVTSSQTVANTVGAEWKPDDREWVAQWGYGIARFPGADDPVPQDASVDPNQDYVDSLPETEKNAYFEALYGALPDETALSNGEPPEYDWTTAGCTGRAGHEVSGEDPLQGEQFQPLMEALQDFWNDSSRYPGMSQIDADWAECMDGAGYPGFVSQSDASRSVSDAYNAAWTGTDGAPKDAVDEAALAQLSSTEIDTALADLDCREKTDYTARTRTAQWEAERAFVDDHRTELDAAKAAAAQARS